MALYTVSITDGTTLANLAVSAGRGPKGDGWTGVTYDNGTGRFTFTSTDGLGYVSDSITGDLDTAVTEAEAAQAAAEAAQAATESIFDQFGDQYLGPKASDPTVDNDGDPLTEGDIYFNTTDDVLKFYSGTAWVAPESIATTAANEAEASATAAATSETNAASSASAASTSETNAASSASAASTSETNAATSETNAASSASAASTSETNAAASETAAAASEAAAAASETAAATSESNAASSASAASTSASNAATSETNAASSASAASTSETNAANSASAAASSYDQFDDRYLGSKSSAPTVDNDGNALLTGALYWDSTLGGLYVWNSTSWEIAGQRDELLQAVAATKSDTAVDVFVYDTSKDSDGGAWRKRTQHTSWYNETLNTSTRGSRKEFPAVAVIVAESNQITIYDGDDPSLPMWMVFNVGGTEWATNNILDQAAHNFITAVQMINGFLVQTSTSSYGARAIDFLNDKSWYYSHSNYKERIYNGGIGQRNSGLGSSEGTKVWGLISSYINDVAMTVLPNAPIDAATGLPVPTIAVATNAGVSVIKDDGTVVDIINSNSNYTSSQKVLLVGPKLYMKLGDDNNATWLYVFNNIPASDVTIPINAQGIADAWYEDRTAFSVDLHFSGKLKHLAKDSIGSPTALTLLDENNEEPSSGMVAYTTSTYNTGWQNGAIKLATLSDTDDTDVTGSELVTNGTFDSDISGWTDWSGAPSSISYSAGKMYLDGNSNYARATQTISTVVGKTYTFTLTASGLSSETFQMWVGTYGAYSSDIANKTFTDNGVSSLTFTATTTTTYITVFSGYTFYIDNVSVRLAEEDRSVNGNGLQVFGSITKNPVASGADLVAYSGFSGSNHLVQPYNSDLDFGTGDFCFMGWAKIASTSTFQGMVTRTYHDGSSYTGGGQIALSVQVDGTLKFEMTDDSWNSRDQVVSSSIDNGNWSHVCALRTGNVLKIYINGVESVSGSVSAAAGSISNSNGIVNIGKYRSPDVNPLVDGTLALWRISATAPSPEQIAKIYEDEKVLFQENAQATLYGSSDAVTALAYDDTTELLHVGTSAGRSVFQGLRRVDNTTDAVGAAISASNGLVAED